MSTGGFSKEARYEADRANVPVMLVDLDELARLVVEHYDGFDADGRALLPLKREAAGLELVRWETDADNFFAIALSRRPGGRSY